VQGQSRARPTTVPLMRMYCTPLLRGGLPIAANRSGSHRAQCLRAISPYWFAVGGSMLIAESPPRWYAPPQHTGPDGAGHNERGQPDQPPPPKPTSLAEMSPVSEQQPGGQAE
jgi:hypothetical protein